MTVLKHLQVTELTTINAFIFLSIHDRIVAPDGFITKEEENYLLSQFKSGVTIATLNTPEKIIFVVASVKEFNKAEKNEKFRRVGVKLCANINALKLRNICIYTQTNNSELLALAEGICLSNYSFLKYKKESKHTLESLYVSAEVDITNELQELVYLLDAVYKSRDLVNEPVIYLTAEQLSIEAERIGKEAGFTTEIFNKSKIQSLKMGGLLAVNSGSIDPPTFTILEYQSPNAVNARPIVLVGKGVVYDTGGLSLKPTENSMDMMKCDMAGAAAVIGTFQAVATNKLPIHIIGLIPATDNRPAGNAVTPGDVITMHNGKTVEVLNTDAEGRLILADALSYAKKYNPELVIDLATLTGAAVRAVGKEAIVYMGNADTNVKTEFEKASWEVFERVVEFPLWDDYDEHIQSSVADIKNTGTSEAGAISAGKFLQHFTDYPWLHLDIAGGSFMTSPFHYWPIGGSGIGVRLLYSFLKNKTK